MNIDRVRRKIGKNSKHEVQSHFLKTLLDFPLFPCENTSRFTDMTASRWGPIWQFSPYPCYLFFYPFKLFDWFSKESTAERKMKNTKYLLSIDSY